MSDPRFARLKTDPRFRRPKKHNSKVVVDKRFKKNFDEGGVGKEKLKQNGKGKEKLGAADSDNESDRSGFVTLGRDLDEEGELDLDAQATAYAKTAPEDNSKEATEKTRRLVVVNLDWDHVRAAHLVNTKSAKATVARGNVPSVRVYLSKLEKERIAREEKEGPHVEVLKKKIENEEDANERTIYETGGGADYGQDALRKYQLERLRYYYAIIECDTAEAAAHIYNEVEGTALERSANVFDLSCVPDEMAFDEEYRDEVIDDPGTRYRAVEFVTDALRLSKVKLTWDDDDPERNHITRRSLTKKEIEEADFKAYIASSSSESDHDQDPVSKKRSKKFAQKDKLRTLLLAEDDDELPEGWGRDDDAGKHDDVDMVIMFTPGLTEATNIEDETKMDVYQRKRKEEVKMKATTGEGGGQPGEKVSFDDDFFEGVSGSEGESEAENASGSANWVSRTWDVDRPVPRQETKSDVKSEKKGKKTRGTKKLIDEVQDDFIVDVNDDRFKAIHEDYQFAIDSSNPHFKKTKNMVALIDERTKRQRMGHPEDETSARLPTN
ncbi:hypothetical protein BDR04DRAFT_1188865 [Suillus decipiens]|nr:hypothetical protein BDR04DRAFT_1188865 [Suillus decipiens]